MKFKLNKIIWDYVRLGTKREETAFRIILKVFRMKRHLSKKLCSILLAETVLI